MSLLITNIETAQTSISFGKEFGIESSRFIKESSYTFSIDDASFEEGNNLLQGIEALNAVYTQKPIVANIGGDIYTQGQLVSISYEETSLAGTVKGSISIREPFQLDSCNQIFNCKFLTDFSDSFNFQRNGAEYSFDRSFSAGYELLSEAEFVVAAKALVGFIDSQKPNYGFLTDSISTKGKFNSNLITKKTETIDLINKSVSFSENFQSQDLVENSLSEDLTITNGVDEEGFTTKDYQINYKKIRESGDFLSLVSGKINQLISSESTNFPSGPSSITRDLNMFEMTANISISFNSNPNDKKSGVTQVSLSKEFDGTNNQFTVSVTAKEIEGDRGDRLISAKTFVNDYPYQQEIVSAFNITNTITETSKSLSYTNGLSEASATLNVNFSDNPIYETEDENVTRFSITIDSTEEKDPEEILDISDLKRKITFPTYEKTIENGSIRLEVNHTSENFFYGESFIEGKIPSFLNQKYITSDSISIDSNGTTTRTISYKDFT